MKRISRPLATLFFIAIAFAPAVVSAKDNWVSVRSKNFFLIGNNSEKEVKQVAVRLEQFRDVFTRLFPNIKFNSTVPVTVVVFKSESSFRPFKPGNVAGYFQPSEDVNYIAMTTELMNDDPFKVIFHEYTHLLVNNTSGNVPLWFNEGLAEYYSTFSITDDQKFALGTPIGYHVLLLRDSKLLPLRTLFQVDHKSPHYNERNKQSIFYAESWALMHYLIIGKEGRVDQLGKFMQLITANVPMEKAFQDAFGMTFEAMEKDLRKYVQQNRYNVLSGHFEHKLETDTQMDSAPISEAEAQAYLGDLLLHSNRKDAETYLKKALSLDPNQPLANASMGMFQFRTGKVDEARASLERAVQASSQNYLIHYYYAYTLSRNGEGDNFSSTYSPEVAAKIYDELQKAIALRPDYPNSYNLLGLVSLVTGNKVDEAMTLLKRAIAASPGRNELALMLGQLYLRTGDYTTARQLLAQAAKSNTDDQVSQHAQALLAQLDSMSSPQPTIRQSSQTAETETAEDETKTKTTGTQIAKSTSTPQVQTDPSAYLREVLRQPLAGETQLQGNVLRIECESKSIIFVISVGPQLMRLKTDSFDEVEITTYASDVKGEITCGPRKEELVIVCFVPQVDKRSKTDGVIKSIEFVPKDFKLK